MEYKGKLYGKVNKKYFPLGVTTEDWDKMEKRIVELEAKKLNQAEVIKSVCEHEPIDKDVPFPICKHCGDMMF